MSRQGFIDKKGDSVGKWNKRFFVLAGGNLSFWVEEKDQQKGKPPKHSVAVKDLTFVVPTDNKYNRSHVGLVRFANKEWILAFHTSGDRDGWVEALNQSKGIAGPAVGNYNPAMHNALKLQLIGEKLDAKDGVGKKSDPYFLIFADDKRLCLYKSEYYKQTLNPTWKPFILPVNRYGGLAKVLTIVVMDRDEDYKDDMIGFATFEFGDLLRMKTFQLKTSHGSSAGVVTIKSVEASQHPFGNSFPQGFNFLVTGTDLEKKDGPLGKSDPFIIMKSNSHPTRILYKSEVVMKNLNPQFAQFTLDIRDLGDPVFKNIDISVYDWDEDGGFDFIGGVTLPATELPFAHQYPLVNPAKAGGRYKNSGWLNIENVTDSSQGDPARFNIPAVGYHLKCSAVKLEKKDGPLGKSDPFFIIQTPMQVQLPGTTAPQSISMSLVRSEVIMKNLNPSWKMLEVPLITFGLNIISPLHVEVYDWDKDGTHDYIGSFTTTMQELTMKNAQFKVFNESKSTPGYQSSGCFKVDSIAPMDAVTVKNYPAAYKFHMSASHLAKSDGPLTKNDPFVTIVAKPAGCPKFVLVYRSETIPKSDRPKWQPILITAEMVGGFHTPFVINVYDADTNGNNDLIGSRATTLYELGFMGPFQYQLRKSGTVRTFQGTLSVDNIEEVPASMIPPPPAAMELVVACKKLANTDGPMSKSDPFFTILAKPLPGAPSVANVKILPNKPIVVYKSEWIAKNLNPLFAPFKLNLADLGGLDAPIEIVVQDHDSDGSHSMIGSLTSTAREFLCGNFSDAITKPGSPGSRGGFFIEKVSPLNQIVVINALPPAFRIKARGQKLAKMDAGPGRKSDPFFRIYESRMTIGTERRPPRLIYRSEVVKQDLNPNWLQFDITTEFIKDWDDPFLIGVYDYDKDGTHDEMGVLEVTLREIAMFSWFDGPIKPRGSSIASTRGCFAIEKIEPLPFAPITSRPAGLQVTTSCARLKRMDGPLSKSDPYFEVLVKPVTDGPYWRKGVEIIYYRSEIVYKNLEPHFQPFQLDAAIIGSLDVPFKFRVMDWDLDGADDVIGEVMVTLREWMFGPVSVGLTHNGSPRGALQVDRVDPLAAVPTLVLPPAIRICAHGRKLAKMDIGVGKKSDPFFQVQAVKQMKTGPSKKGKKITLYRSEVVKQELNPKWQPFELDVTMIGGLDTPIFIDVFDWDSNGGHDLIGNITITLRQIMVGWFHGPLINPGSISGSSKGAFDIQWFTPIPPLMKRLAPIAIQAICSAQKLDSKNGPLGKSDAFFEIVALPVKSKKVQRSKEIILHRSEVVKGSLNPAWGPVLLNLSDLVGWDYFFEVRVFDWEADGAHKLIGKLQTTLRNWSYGSFQQAIVHPDKIRRPGYESSGAFSLDSVVPLTAETRKEVPVAFRIQCSAQKLEKKDPGILAKSDPFFVIKSLVGQKITLWRSEVIKQQLDVTWHPFELRVADVGGFDSEFEVIVYDWDADGGHDEIGRLQTTLRNWTFGPYQQKLTNADTIRSNKSRGAFSLDWIQPLLGSQAPILFPAYGIQASGYKLARKDILSKSDAFFEIRTIVNSPNPRSRPLLVHRSNVLKNESNPTWDAFEISSTMVGGFDVPFQVSCFDVDSGNGKHELIGQFVVTLREFMFGPCVFALRNPSKIVNSSQGGFEVTSVVPLQLDQLKVLAPAYEITLVGHNIESVDTLSKSDCFFKIIARPKGEQGSYENVTVYKSEVIPNDKSPKWKPFQLNITDFGGHVDAEFLVEVYDIDPNGTTTFIGGVESTFREWTFGPFQQAIYRDASKSRGSLNLVSIAPLPAPVQRRFPSAFKLTTRATRLERMNKAGLGKSDPYFELTAMPTATTRDLTPGSPANRPITLYRSPVVKDTLDPSWPDFYLTVDMVGSLDTDFEIAVYDEDDDGDNRLIGKTTMTLRELSWGRTLVPLLNDDKTLANKSRGGFCFDVVTPVAQGAVPPPPPCFDLSVAVSKLESKNAGVGNKSDPFFEIYVPKRLPDGSARSILVYRSEHYDRVSSTKFRPFKLNVSDIGGLDVYFLVRVLDYESSGDHHLIGELGTTLREWLYVTPGSPYRQKLVDQDTIRSSKSRGAFIIEACVPVAAKDMKVYPPAYRFSVSAQKVESKDGLLSKSDPFFRVECRPDGFTEDILIYRSEVIQKSSEPAFQAFELPVELFRGLDTPFKISLYDWDANGGHDFIGGVATTLRELAFGQYTMKLTDPSTIRAQKSRGGLNVLTTPIDYIPRGPVVAPAWLISTSGRELDLSEFLRDKVEVFFEVKRGDNLLYRSEFASNSKDAAWQPFVLNLRDVGSLDNPFTISVYDADETKRGAHKLVGRAVCNIREWLFNLPWDEALVHPDKTWRINYQSSGALRINSIQPLGVEKVPPLPIALDVRVSGHSVDSKDLLGKSDPFFVVKNNRGLILWRSEVQKQTLNPDWSNKPFILSTEMVGGYTTHFDISVFDWNADGLPDLIGVLSTNLQAINQGRPHTFAVLNPIKAGMPRYFTSGGLNIQSKPVDLVPTFAPSYKFDISAKGLDRKDGPLAKSDPYLEVQSVPVGFSKPMTVVRTEVCPKTLDATWKAFSFNINEAGGFDAPIQLAVSDFDKDGQHDLIGFVRTTLREISLGPFDYPIIHPDKKGRVGYRSSGSLRITSVTPEAPNAIKPPPQALRLTFSAIKLDRRSPIYTCDPALEIRRLFTNEKTDPLLVYKTETLQNTLEPQFKTFDVSELMVGGIDVPFLVRIVDMSDPRRVVGSTTLSLRQISLGPFTFALINPDKTGLPTYTSSGGLQIQRVEQIPLSSLPPVPPALRFSFACTEVDNSDAKQDLSIEVWRMDAGAILYRSERVQYGGRAAWKDIDLSMSQLGGLDFPICFRVTWLNWKKSKIAKVGASVTSLRELLFTNGATILNLIHPKRQRRTPRYTHSAKLEVKLAVLPGDLPIRPTFGYIAKLNVTYPAGKRYYSPLYFNSKALDSKSEITLGRFPSAETTTQDVWFPIEGTSGFDTPIQARMHKGKAEFTLRELIGPGQPTFFIGKPKLKNKIRRLNDCGVIQVLSVQPLAVHWDSFSLNIAATKLTWSSATSINPIPFVEIQAFRQPAWAAEKLWETIVTTPVVQSDSPTYQAIPISAATVGGMDARLKFCFWSHSPDGNHSLIGEVSTSLRQLYYQEHYSVIHPIKRQTLTTYENSGTVLAKLQPSPQQPTTPFPPPLALPLPHPF